MKDRFCKLSKLALMAFCLAVTCVGFYSCSDDYDLDDEGNYPSWLGNSIYEELKNPNQEILTGTFTNYLKLIDDLDYTETLSKTGSKTVFPANDEAFARFYASNSWGVKDYSGLTTAMKKQLLYSSMLDNALLLEMLSNVQNDETSVTKGIAIKHTTSANVIDTITHIYGPAGMPVNNSYWDKYKSKGIDLVMDATRPMMVHFTNEQMTTNNITTQGTNSDFEIITGSKYSEGMAYIFRDKVIKSDVTCKNGYIQQMEDVLVPPGNLAELIRTNGETNYFSRMLDRFSAPYFDATTTNNYNDYAQTTSGKMIDSIYQKRYLSERSQGTTLKIDPNGNTVSTDILLPYDPGWNTYTNGSTVANALSDVAAMFVPNDEAMKTYLLPGGSGAFLIDQYGKLSNTEANLGENIDSIPLNIVQAFVSNLMKSSFVGSVPSKFDNVMDDASDPMGLAITDIEKNSDETYDVKIANNGVAYILNKVFAPTKYVAVSAPALFSDEMRVMNWAIQDKSTLGLNFYAYLLAMSANYALFVPDDEAFSKYYVDPTYLGHSQPRALKFYYNTKKSPYIFCSTWTYDPSTGVVGDSTGVVSVSTVKTQLTDILNYHTVVLGSGETIGSNKYYKTKHGGEIMVDGSEVASGSQIDGTREKSNIKHTYNQQNGHTYRISHVIEPPTNSVYKTLSDSRFSEFMNLCSPVDSIMTWAGISNVVNKTFNTSEQDKYYVFVKNNGLDDNVQYFNTYNYTVYAPNNSAMQKAYSAGLPKWSDIASIINDQSNYETDDKLLAAKAKAKDMIDEINKFIRYHFQDNSVYADNTVDGGTYQTSCVDTLGIYQKLKVTGGNNVIDIVDNRGVKHEISTTSGLMVNKMARDYVFDNTASKAASINTSSFAVIHELSEPLNYHTNTDLYNAGWSSAKAMKSAIYRYKKFLKAQSLKLHR
jgi:uncharacterized surface protein with fasciclin (FAS1) repeats